MDLKGIISVSGISGLSKIIAKTKNGIVCESLTDKKRFPVLGSEKVSALEDISIYTDEGEKPIKEVFQLILKKENNKVIDIDLKGDPTKLRAYLESVLPNYDRERVYNSDIKKLLSWYNILVSQGLITLAPEEPNKENTTADTSEKAKPAKKAAAKKTKAKKEETPDTTEEKIKKPAKKAAPKKGKKTNE
jgi:hypothetical protein